MNGAQDLGGMMGFGPVAPQPDEPLFHAAWERRAMALTLAMGASGTWTLDAGRHARETLPPPDYLTSSYYEIWIEALVKLLLAHGLASQDEVAAGAPSGPGIAPKRVIAAAEVPAALARGTPCRRETTRPAAFAEGGRVRARHVYKATHTRLPRYAFGRTGTVVGAHGMFALPDTNAHGQGECPEWLYTVRFTGRELWGETADPALAVMADLWESYLDAA